jgi:uncharacterized protein YjbI with pentapeptide repeats
VSNSSSPPSNSNVPFIKGGNYRGLRFENDDFSRANLSEIDLTQAVLIGANFRESKITSCIFDAVQARGTQFQLTQFHQFRAQYGDFEDSSFQTLS